MQDRIKALEDPNPVDQLACLVLRVLAELSPCTERALVGCVSGGDHQSLPGQASHSHTRELVHSALLKLKALTLIQFAQERIAITDEGKRCLESLPFLRQRDCAAEARDGRANRRVAIAYRQQDRINSITEGVSSLSQLQAGFWTHYSALLRVLLAKPRARTQYGPRLKRLCQDSLAQVSVTMPGLCRTIGRRWDSSLCVWKQKVTPMIQSGATIVIQAFSRRREPKRLFEKAGQGKTGARLLKILEAKGLLPHRKFAGFGFTRSINFAGALLLVCSALLIAGGVLFLSGERVTSSSAEEASPSGHRARDSRAWPIVWLHDEQDHLGPSIFVTRKLAGAAWVEGLAISGENASSQTLTGLQGAIKTDSGEEIKLGVKTEGSQGRWDDAQDVPSGSRFMLRSALIPDGAQTGVSAEEFLSKHGGMIFRVSYAVAGVQTTLIEYFTAAKLRAQLAERN